MNRNGWYTKQHQQIKYIQCIGIWHRWMKWRRCEVQEWSEINTKRITFHKLLLQLQMCQQNVKKLLGIKSVRNLVHRSGTASVLISNGKSIFHIINFNFSLVNRWFFPYQNWTKLITCASPIPQAFTKQGISIEFFFFFCVVFDDLILAIYSKTTVTVINRPDPVGAARSTVIKTYF